MRVVALAGGVGGSKLLVGLQRALQQGALTAIVNTGDDATTYGVHVSPDVDIVTYWLAGVADFDRGWGLKDDTFTVVDALGKLGVDNWFRLGDRDLATCLYRTEQLRAGVSLSAVTDDIRRSLGVPTRILPMSDELAPTTIVLRDGRTLEFQEYFVRERHTPEVDRVLLGSEGAKPAPGLLEAITEADLVVVCPSNPVVSVGPILALREVRGTLSRHPRVIAVTPIVDGKPLKGPADKLIPTLGAKVSAAGVAGLYADFCDVFVVDESDRAELDAVAALGLRAVAVDTIMSDHDASEHLARKLLAL